MPQLLRFGVEWNLSSLHKEGAACSVWSLLKSTPEEGDALKTPAQDSGTLVVHSRTSPVLDSLNPLQAQIPSLFACSPPTSTSPHTGIYMDKPSERIRLFRAPTEFPEGGNRQELVRRISPSCPSPDHRVLVPDCEACQRRSPCCGCHRAAPAAALISCGCYQ